MWDLVWCLCVGFSLQVLVSTDIDRTSHVQRQFCLLHANHVLNGFDTRSNAFTKMNYGSGCAKLCRDSSIHTIFSPRLQLVLASSSCFSAVFEQSLLTLIPPSLSIKEADCMWNPLKIKTDEKAVYSEVGKMDEVSCLKSGRSSCHAGLIMNENTQEYFGW